MNTTDNISELHPLEPFLPANARLLMLGSFPPQRIRWSMDFFYPNLQNDMWRIIGHIFYGEREHFLSDDRRRFDKARIVDFCNERGLALYDTAVEVIRLKNNASDNFLQVVREVDLPALLAAVPPLPCNSYHGTEGHRYAMRRHGLRTTSGSEAAPDSNTPAAACVSTACHHPRAPTRALWSGKRSSTVPCSRAEGLAADTPAELGREQNV